MSEGIDKLLLTALRAIERKCGCSLCFHDYTGLIAKTAPEIAPFHQNAFCSALKELHQKFTTTCVAFDKYAVQQRSVESAGPFFKYCPCGLLEAVVPILIHGKPAGVLFAGPFRPSGRLPQGTLKCGKTTEFPDLAKRKAALPELTAADMEALPALCHLAAARIAQLAETAPEQSGGSRKDLIQAFLARNFRGSIGLPDLAKHLGLSESRSSQLVKSLLGASFSELLTQRRLEQAKALLRNSQFKIITVARLSGFRDPAYFHRVFQRAERISPLAYRRLHVDAQEKDAP